MSYHIHIVTPENSRLKPNYLLGYLAELWEEAGCRITYGPIRTLDADIGIMHIDETWVSEEILPSNPRNLPLLNADVLNISKSFISANLVKQGSDYAGPVIIKTDANYFGLPELKQKKRWSLKRLLRNKKAPAHLWRLFRELPQKSYPILDSVTAVPNWVWKRNDLVVEKFLPERVNGQFVLRLWIFLGEADYGAKVFSNEPVVKTGNMTHYEYLDEVPDSLREIRKKLNMDFGKFDYVMVDGEALLLDVNKTPSISAQRTPNSRARRLKDGLLPFLGKGI